MPTRNYRNVDKSGCANLAQHEDGSIHEARDIWLLGYTKNGWTCVDEKCRARMVPCAWTNLGKDGWFYDDDGVQYKRPPYFRAEPIHHLDCDAGQPSAQTQNGEPEYHLGPPVEYPSRVTLFPLVQAVVSMPGKLTGSENDEPVERPHARWVRSIREACEFFVAKPGEHWRPLRVDLCSGAQRYAQCFQRFGTGDHKDVGKHRIFYDEIRFRVWADLDAEPIRLTLLGSIGGQARTLVIHAADWLPEHRRNLRTRLRIALGKTKSAWRSDRPERAWIFAVTKERSYDEPEVEAHLQAGVDVLFCVMPRLAWRYRPTHRFATRMWQNTEHDNTVSEPPTSTQPPGSCPETEPQETPHNRSTEPAETLAAALKAEAGATTDRVYDSVPADISEQGQASISDDLDNEPEPESLAVETSASLPPVPVNDGPVQEASQPPSTDTDEEIGDRSSSQSATDEVSPWAQSDAHRSDKFPLQNRSGVFGAEDLAGGIRTPSVPSNVFTLPQHAVYPRHLGQVRAGERVDGLAGALDMIAEATRRFTKRLMFWK